MKTRVALNVILCCKHMQKFITLVTSSAFWTQNRKIVACSALVPLLLSLISTDVADLMSVYMNVCFPLALLCRSAARVKKEVPGSKKSATQLLKIGHRTYSQKELHRIATDLYTIFIGSILLVIITRILGGFLSAAIPYMALHLYCLKQNHPLSIVKEAVKRIRLRRLSHRPYYLLKDENYKPGVCSKYWLWNWLNR